MLFVNMDNGRLKSSHLQYKTMDYKMTGQLYLCLTWCEYKKKIFTEKVREIKIIY